MGKGCEREREKRYEWIVIKWITGKLCYGQDVTSSYIFIPPTLDFYLHHICILFIKKTLKNTDTNTQTHTHTGTHTYTLIPQT